jgi:hypothetical protein
MHTCNRQVRVTPALPLPLAMPVLYSSLLESKFKADLRPRTVSI